MPEKSDRNSGSGENGPGLTPGTFHAAVENMQQGFAIFSPVRDEGGDIVDLRYEYVNPTACELNRMEAEEMLGHTLLELFPATKGAGLMDVYAEVIETGKTFHGEDVWLEVEREGRMEGRVFDSTAIKVEEGIAFIWRDVTDRWREQRELETAHARFRRMVTEAADGIVVVNMEGEALYLNRAAEELLGRSAGEIAGSSFGYPVTRDGPTDIQIIRKNGSIAHAEMQTVKTRWDNAEAYLVNLRDITMRKQAEQALRQSEEQYRSLYNSIRDAILVSDKDRRIIHCNPAFTDLFGYSLDEIRHRQIAHVYANREEYEELGEQIREHADEPGFLYTVNYQKKSGEVFPGETGVFELKDGRGEGTGFIGLIRDVSQRLEEERQIRFQAELLNAVQQAVIATDAGGRVIYWNRAARELFGWSEDEVMGRSIVDVTPSPEFRNQAEEIMATLLKGDSWSGQFTLRRRDGSTFEAMVHDSPMMDREGNLRGVIGITTDISDELYMARELRKLHQAVRQSPAAVIITNLEGRVEYVNPRYEEISGYEEADVLGRPFPLLQDGNVEEVDHREIWDAIRARGIWQGEYENVDAQGDPYWVYTIVSPLYERGDEMTHVVITKLDITQLHELEQEKVNLENEISRQFHLSQVGLLASGISHNIRSPLTSISMNTDLLRQAVENLLNEQPQDPFVYYDALEKMEKSLLTQRKSADRIERIVDDLSDYHRMNRDASSLVDLNEVLRGDAAMLKADMDLKHRIRMALDLKPGPLMVKARASEVGQIFLNLVANARDALLEVDEKEITVRSGVLDEDTAWFEVRDTGPGVPPEVLERIGEPFVTTKAKDPKAIERGSGSGLGLYMNKRLLSDLGGRMTVNSEPGDTRFRVQLPRAKEGSGGEKE